MSLLPAQREMLVLLALLPAQSELVALPAHAAKNAELKFMCKNLSGCL
jgi:hypothetical protein